MNSWPVVTVVPGTKNRKVLDKYPSVYAILPTVRNGLDVETFFMPFQIQTVDKADVTNHLGECTPAELADVEAIVKAVLGF
jgi:mRNA-degrading endonuclease toxin of MazEF toxin-antitoxin module